MSLKNSKQEAAIVELFSKPRFGAIDDEGDFVDFSDDKTWMKHPLASRGRWIGGAQDRAVVLAAFKLLSE